MSSLTTEYFPAIDLQSLGPVRHHIRPVAEKDFDRIEDLQRRSGTNAGSAPLLKRLLFGAPWSDERIRSLVCEDSQGRLLAFLGVIPRPMSLAERPIVAAVAHHLTFAASRAGTRASIEIVRCFLDGPQDLSLALWNDFGRRIWTMLGGDVTPLYSFVWTRALRPARYFLEILKDRGLSAPAAMTLHPACQAVDATLRLFGRRVLQPQSTTALSDDLDPVTMFSCLSVFANDRLLKPRYDVPSLSWILATLSQSAVRGQLQKVAVRSNTGRALGWYVYSLAGAAAEVLQVGGKDDALSEVVRHLFDHARRRGAVSVTGPMDTRLVSALSENQCAFRRSRNAWVLIHSRNRQSTEAIHAGDAFLSRLELRPWLG